MDPWLGSILSLVRLQRSVKMQVQHSERVQVCLHLSVSSKSSGFERHPFYCVSNSHPKLSENSLATGTEHCLFIATVQ